MTIITLQNVFPKNPSWGSVASWLFSQNINMAAITNPVIRKMVAFWRVVHSELFMMLFLLFEIRLRGDVASPRNLLKIKIVVPPLFYL